MKVALKNLRTFHSDHQKNFNKSSVMIEQRQLHMLFLSPGKEDESSTQELKNISFRSQKKLQQLHGKDSKNSSINYVRDWLHDDIQTQEV